MKLKCQACKRTFTIPDNRLPKVESAVILPCPVCRGDIRIGPRGQEFSGSGPETGPVKKPPQIEGSPLQKQILASVIKLPPMPQVAQKVHRLIVESDVSFSDVERVIMTDQTIVAQLLKLANSAYYGFRGKISSVKHVISLLGTRSLKEVLFMSCASKFLKSCLEGYGYRSDDLWRHSLAVAIASKTLAGQVSPELEDNAFSAGLIHDIGKLILDPYVLERKDRFEKVIEKGNQSFLDAERQILGFDHAQIAARVCEKWMLPSELAVAIRYHHTLPAVEDITMLTHILHAADAICIMAGIGIGEDGMLYEVDERSMHVIGLESSDIPRLCSRTMQRVGEILSEFPDP